jgi:hypothetical protein
MRSLDEQRTGILLVGIALVAGWGCSDDAPALECDDVPASFSPCGGDPTGSWEVVKNCPGVLEYGAPLPIRDMCPAATTRLALEYGGTLEVDATMLQWGTTTFSAVEDVLVPAECVTSLWAGDCANVQEVLSPERPGMTCAAAASGDCNCHYEEFEQDDTNDSYTYDILDGDQIRYGTGPNDSPTPFCVRGNEMTWEADTVNLGIQYMTFRRR